MIQLANIQDKMKEIEGKPWFPIDIVEVNDQVVRLAYAKGEYHWHIHQEEDEMFYLLAGEFTVRMKNYDDYQMEVGQCLVVPKGEEHAPMSEKGGFILMFEPKETKSRGD
ncbi:MAG: cupin domain-containing protein [Candidatus Kariarchaeaceae archaeon]|jgi:mannose-6-phosphate isomerase-like protein (cupin superfamily)